MTSDSSFVDIVSEDSDSEFEIETVSKKTVKGRSKRNPAAKQKSLNTRKRGKPARKALKDLNCGKKVPSVKDRMETDEDDKDCFVPGRNSMEKVINCGHCFFES